MIPYRITIHCTATKNGIAVPAKTIDQWHKDRGWAGIGYHMVIQPDGEVENGRSLNALGAHVENENEGNIGIVLAGENKFTEKALYSLRYRLHSLFITYPTIKHWDLYCHNEFESARKQGKTCPGFSGNRLRHWYWVNPSALKEYELT